MSLKTEFQDLAVELIDSDFVSTAQAVTIVKPIDDGYDAEAGMVFESSSNITVNGIITPWNDNNRASLNSDTIQSSDVKLLVAYKDVSNADAQITNTNLKILPLQVNFHRIEIGTAQYDIIELQLDAAQALFIMRLRKLLDPFEN